MTKIWSNSGDSHYMEPPDLFETNLPKSMAERMPRSVKDPDGQYETIYVDGQTIRRKIPSVLRKPGTDGQTMADASMSRTTGGIDMEVRLADLDQEGIWAEVMYPSLGVWSWLIRDPELDQAGTRLANDWVFDTVVKCSPRLLPTARLSMLSVDNTVAELQRCAGLGFKIVALPVELPEWQDDINQPYWEPLWSAAEEAGIVVGFHVGAGVIGKLDPYRGPGSVIINYVETSYPAQRAANKMVASGVLERHPGLKVLISEGGASWVPFIGDRMNEAYRQHSGFVRPPLAAAPKEILYRQVYASFQHDESAIGAVTSQGYRNVMWGSDYPHLEGTFGHTQETLHGLFDDVDPEVSYRIRIGAFCELFPDAGEPPGESEGEKVETSTVRAGIN